MIATSIYNVKDFLRASFLSVEKRYDYLSANLMYNIFYDQAPSYLCQFKRVVSVHSYGTRGSEMNYLLPEIKTQGKKTFMYMERDCGIVYQIASN